MQALEESSGQGTAGFFRSAPLTDEAASSVASQNRVIVRTVSMGLIVPNVASSADRLVDLTRRYNGWVVTSDRSREHEASLSVRVPAETLEGFVLDVRDAADRVEYETSTSQDITDEFVDNQARLTGLRRTEARLLEFLDQAVDVEEALEVQGELAEVQIQIEEIEGRLRFMEETAVFSLVHLSLSTRPGRMPVDIGPDATFRAGIHAGFRATFQPPEGVDEFKFVWDFGDGSQPVEGTRTAPSTKAGERVTATVSHTFTNVEQSPYIVQLDIRGIGDAGLFLGSDTLIASVSQIPIIEVFAGEGRVVDEGDEVEYTGSFTRPEGLWDFRHRWDFGDGSATVFEALGESETRAVVQHAFSDYRPNPYQVVLTIIAQSEAGEIRSSGAFNVQVNEVEGFVVAGWNVGGTFKSAVRALSLVGRALLTVLIWMGIFSPVWLTAIAVGIFIPRMRRRFGRGIDHAPSVPPPPLPQETGLSGTAANSPAGSAPPREAGGGFTPAQASEQPMLTCLRCGVTFPAANESGQPARFCPSCGATAPQPENEEQSSSA